jgi:hypothetical protein
MSLRSSIENFLRFSGGISDGQALKTTSVFVLFDIASATPQFLGERKKFHSQLRGIYTELCKETHTASLDHMASVHSLNHFPEFDARQFKNLSRHAKQVVVAVATVLTLACPELFLKAHFETKEIIEQIVAIKERKAILFGNHPRG